MCGCDHSLPGARRRIPIRARLERPRSKLLVTDGDEKSAGPLLDTGFACKPGKWYKLTLRVDVAKRTWEFLGDDRRFVPPRPLGFRTRAEYLDVVNFLVEGGFTSTPSASPGPL